MQETRNTKQISFSPRYPKTHCHLCHFPKNSISSSSAKSLVWFTQDNVVSNLRTLELPMNIQEISTTCKSKFKLNNNKKSEKLRTNLRLFISKWVWHFIILSRKLDTWYLLYDLYVPLINDCINDFNQIYI